MGFRVTRHDAENLSAECLRAAAKDAICRDRMTQASRMLGQLIADRDQAVVTTYAEMMAVAEMVERETALWPEDVLRLHELAERVRARAAILPDLIS